MLEEFRYHAASAEDRVFAALNATFILIILLALTIQPWWFCIALLLHSFCSFHALRRTWPGYALILGSSSYETTKRLVMLVQRCVDRHLLFTTNLLNFVAHSEIEHELFKATSYRLKNEVISWKSAVEIHGVFARVIVLDATHVSDAVREELQIIMDCGFWYKTLLLCPTEESRIAASQLISMRPDCLVVESPEQVKSTLEALLEKFPAHPTQDKCLSRMLNPQHDDERAVKREKNNDA